MPLAIVSPSTNSLTQPRNQLPLAERESGKLGNSTNPAGEDALAIELVLSCLEQVAPRGDIRATAEKGATLTLGHATPDAELDAVVESIGKAVGANHAAGANGLGPVLGGSLHEKGVRV